MESYDHGRAYLWSKDLKWSWPSFSLRHRAWQQRMTDRTDEDFIKHAIYSGFDAIWIDKAAYADGGVELISSFKKAKLTEIPVQSDRIVILDLTAESAAMKTKMTDAQFMQAAKASFGSVIETGWADGFYEEERSTEGFTFRWSRKTSAVTLRNGSDEALIACVRFSLASPQSGEVSLTSEGVEQLFFIATKDVQISLPILMPARHVANISLRSSMSQVDSGSDSRSLYFYVKNYVVDVYSDKARCVSAMR
jgi:hypothetical protein